MPLTPRIIKTAPMGTCVQESWIDRKGEHTRRKKWQIKKLDDSTYLMYVYFKRKYNFGHSETMSMLAGNANSCGGKNVEAFKRGEFKINDFSRATQIAERIIQFAPYYEGFKRRSFVLAMLKIMSNPAYNHEQMISKVSYQSNKIKDQTRAQDYIDVLEKIYNFKTREEYVRFDLAA